MAAKSAGPDGRPMAGESTHQSQGMRGRALRASDHRRLSCCPGLLEEILSPPAEGSPVEAVPAGESNAAGEAQASEGEEQPQVSRVVAEADSAVEVQSQADGEGGQEAGAAFVADGVGCAPALSADVGGGSAWPPLLTMHSWTIGHFALHPSPRALAQTRHLGHARRTRADIAHVRLSTGYGYGYMVPNTGQAAVPIGMFQPPQQFPAMGMVPAMMPAGDKPQVHALLFLCISPCDSLLTSWPAPFDITPRGDTGCTSDGGPGAGRACAAYS